MSYNRILVTGGAGFIGSHLMDELVKERFIYISTCAVYGEPEYLPVDEKHPTNPISPYAESKLKAEQASMKFQEDYGLKTTIFRLFNLYGPRRRNDQYCGARYLNRKFMKCFSPMRIGVEDLRRLRLKRKSLRFSSSSVPKDLRWNMNKL